MAVPLLTKKFLPNAHVLDIWLGSFVLRLMVRELQYKGQLLLNFLLKMQR